MTQSSRSWLATAFRPQVLGGDSAGTGPGKLYEEPRRSYLRPATGWGRCARPEERGMFVGTCACGNNIKGGQEPGSSHLWHQACAADQKPGLETQLRSPEPLWS